MNDGQAPEPAATLGRRVAAQREDRHWTQRDLAERAGISVAFLSEIENDKRNLSTEVLLRIADALGASMDYLATGRTEAPVHRPALVIPPELAAAADRNGWSFTHATDLLRARQLVLSRRSRGGQSTEKHWAAEDWEDFDQRLFGDESA